MDYAKFEREHVNNIMRTFKRIDRHFKIKKIMNTTCNDIKQDKKDDDKPSPGIVLPIA